MARSGSAGRGKATLVRKREKDRERGRERQQSTMKTKIAENGSLKRFVAVDRPTPNSLDLVADAPGALGRRPMHGGLEEGDGASDIYIDRFQAPGSDPGLSVFAVLVAAGGRLVMVLRISLIGSAD